MNPHRIRATWVTTGSALAVIGAAAVGSVVGATAGGGLPEARAGSRASGASSNLVVTLVTPTVNQEVLPDLSDPGLNNVITVRFSAPLAPRDFISNSNPISRLTPAVEFMDASFVRLPGSPRVRGNTFVFDPRTDLNQGVLANGQYTLNIKSSVRSRKGKLLNNGLKDFTATFSVGVDVYPPVIRTISPIHNQQNIGLNQKIIATFNEPIASTSILTTITVTDVTSNPPRQIFGVNGGTGLTLDRGGFDVVFTPDPCFGYPPKSTIEFQMQGAPIGGTPVAGVEDAFRNTFRRDAALHWRRNLVTNLWDSPNGTYEDATGLFKMQFLTRGIVPPPVALQPGNSQYRNPLCPTATVSSNGCIGNGRVFLYTTGTGLGEVDITGIVVKLNAGQEPSYTESVVVPNSPVRTGRPGGLMVDPRWDAANANHTFIYLVDQRSATVLVLDSRNLKTLGRFVGFSSPRDVGMSTDFGASRATMFVTDFGAQQAVALDLSSIVVRLGGQPGAASPCASIADNSKNRIFIPTGRGPTEVAGDCYLLNRAMVVNSLDNSVTLIDSTKAKALKTYQVGGNPLSCDWTLLGFGSIDACAITNQGGLTDPNGSVSLYFRAPPLQPGLPAAGQFRDDIESTLTDGVKNPTYVWGNQEWAIQGNSAPNAFFVPNTGGKTIMDLRLNVTGAFGLLIDLRANQVREVGFNPTGAMLDPYYPNQVLFACVAGEGQFAGMDSIRNQPPGSITVPGMRRFFTCYTH